MKVVIKKTGEVKDVTDGHARNYLIPKGLAVIATEQAMQEAEAIQKQHAAEMANTEAEFTTLLASLPSVAVTVSAKANEDGTLFGSVHESAILEAVQAQHAVVLDKKWLQLPADLKHVGEHLVGVQLPNEAKGTFTINIVAE